MPSRISDILTTLASGEDGSRSNYDIFAQIFEGLDQRLAVIENVSTSLAALQEQLATSSQGIVDAALDPVLASIEAKADLGAILTASSVSEQTVGVGTKTFVLAPEASWPMFAPAHILSISATDNPLVHMYGRRVSYDPTTGTLVVDVITVSGSGTISSWTIAPGSIASMATALTVAPAGDEITGPTLQSALSQIAAALNARQAEAQNLTALAALSLVANQVIGTGSDGSPELFPVSAYGKSLLSTVSADALRSAINAAPTSSPSFSGTPTVPTASIAADSNQIANVTAVRAAVAALVNSSPAALDTLSELAAALGNNPNFATTITNALAGKQDLSAVLTSLAAAASGTSKADFRNAIGAVFGGPAPPPAGAGLGLSNGDFNTINIPGLYSISSTWSNGPLSGGAAVTHAGLLEVRVRAPSTHFYQTLYLTNGQVWTRFTATADAATWPNPWLQIPVAQTSQTDATAGRALTVGAFGLGGLGVFLTSADDLNNLTATSGIYQWGSDLPANSPSPSSGLLNIRRTASNGAQIIFPFSDNPPRWRAQFNGIWTSWRVLPREVLGTVSQSSGVPTGALIERGSNANGEYVRFADGTQICWTSVGVGDVTTASGALFISPVQTWTFPAAFLAGSVLGVSGASTSASGRFVAYDTANQSAVNFRVIGPQSQAAVTTSRHMAIGRWF